MRGAEFKISRKEGVNAENLAPESFIVGFPIFYEGGENEK